MAKAKEEEWKKIVKNKIIPAFPSPWAEVGSDKKFESYIGMSLRHLDALKNGKKEQKCYLGKAGVWINDKSALSKRKAKAVLPKKGEDLSTVTKGMVNFFNAMVDWGHPKTVMNVVPAATLPSISANLFSAIFSPNIIEEEYSVNVAVSEIEAIAMTAQMLGYDQKKAGGVFTFGGLGTWLYALKMGVTTALGKKSRYKGISKNPQILCSKVAHFSKENCSDWIGIGMDNVRQIRLNSDNSMDIDALKEEMEKCIREKKPIAAIVATLGTTDAFGIDNVKEIVKARDQIVKKHKLKYKPWVHADSVIGWAFTCFNHYDFKRNPLGFSDEIKSKLFDTHSKIKHIALADSIGIDFHKSGYTSYISSLFILKEGKKLDLLRRPANTMAYLFEFSAYNPGEYTLESSRSAAGPLAAWANLKYFGTEGYQVLLGRVVDAEIGFRAALKPYENMCIVNPEDHGFVSLFRVYPPGVNAEEAFKEDFDVGKNLEKNNRYIYDMSKELCMMHRNSNGPLLSFTSNFRPSKKGKPMAALKVFPMTPYSSPETMKKFIVPAILKAQKAVDRKRKRH